ncbi:hypothetical protein LC724_25230 [Blautia sp. RD014234]|nr:hypothetical protein [Blautia parvula]
MPVAEETGMIVEIAYQILDKVCKFVNRLSENGIEFDGVHVNFSGQQFSQIGLAEKVEGSLRQTIHLFPRSRLR